MHDVDLIRDTAQDETSARLLLHERTEAMEAIVHSARDYGLTLSRITEASEASLTVRAPACRKYAPTARGLMAEHLSPTSWGTLRRTTVYTGISRS